MKATKKCPNCGSDDITFFVGFITGNYNCKKCGYLGPFVMEETRTKTKKKTATKKR